MAGSEGIPLILKLKITKSVNIISFLGSSSARALFPEPSIKTEDLVQVQLNTGLSNLGMKKLASTINRVSDTKIVETSFLAKFEAIGKQLSEFFTQTSIQVLSESNSTDFVVVHCKDLAELLNEVLLSRRVFQNHIFKLGIDGGGGFLKVSLGIMELDSHCDSRSPPRKKLLTQRTAKDSSVKRQMLVALSEGLPENFENVRQILSLIKLDKVNFVVSCDMKLANILCGLQSHASTHPCSWCNTESKHLSQSGSLRTLGSLVACYQEFAKSGGDIKKARSFGNVVHEPLLSGSENKLILELIPPMELHLLLGVVNHMYKAMTEVWPNVVKWPSALHIQQEPYHGGQFAGNACHKLLSNLDLLQRIAETESAFQVFGIIDALRKFKSVVTACFGMVLEDDFSEKIDRFRDSYLAIMNISVTPKVHAVFFHVKQFIEIKRAPLGVFSEQATESMHHNFSSHWQRYKRDRNHPEYAKRLLSCVVDYNSKHL